MEILQTTIARRRSYTTEILKRAGRISCRERRLSRASPGERARREKNTNNKFNESAESLVLESAQRVPTQHRLIAIIPKASNGPSPKEPSNLNRPRVARSDSRSNRCRGREVERNMRESRSAAREVLEDSREAQLRENRSDGPYSTGCW